MPAVSTQQQQHAASTIFVAGRAASQAFRNFLLLALRAGQSFRDRHEQRSFCCSPRPAPPFPPRTSCRRRSRCATHSQPPERPPSREPPLGIFPLTPRAAFFFRGSIARRLQAMFPKMAIVAENYMVSTTILRTAMLRTGMLRISRHTGCPERDNALARPQREWRDRPELPGVLRDGLLHFRHLCEARQPRCAHRRHHHDVQLRKQPRLDPRLQDRRPLQPGEHRRRQYCQPKRCGHGDDLGQDERCRDQRALRGPVPRGHVQQCRPAHGL